MGGCPRQSEDLHDDRIRVKPYWIPRIAEFPSVVLSMNWTLSMVSALYWPFLLKMPDQYKTEVIFTQLISHIHITNDLLHIKGRMCLSIFLLQIVQLVLDRVVEAHKPYTQISFGIQGPRETSDQPGCSVDFLGQYRHTMMFLALGGGASTF